MAFGQQKLSKETGGPDFYQEYTTTNLYVERSFSGALHTITIKNDSATDPVQLSFDGSTLESDVKVGETLEINVAAKTSIYVKATAGGDTVRIWGWADLKGAGSTDGLTDTQLRATPVPVSGTVTVQEPLSVDDNGGSLTIDATSLPLPTGASTSALQTTGNAVLTTIDTVLDNIYIEQQVKANPTENQYVAEQNIGIAGAGVEGTVALTTAWQQCPPSGSVPSASYQLWIAKENEAGVVRIATASASSPSVTYGRRMRDNEEVVLAGTAFIYVASSVAGDDINWGTKEIL